MLNLRWETLNWQNLKFIFKPWDAITLIRGYFPKSQDFQKVVKRSIKEINSGFKFLPEHARSLQKLTKTPIKTLNRYFQDLKHNKQFYKHLQFNIIKYGCAAGITIDIFAPVYYVMVRAQKPNVIVETGVANGISSCFLLQALSDNKKGKLYSIDMPGFITKHNASSGWLIPEWLRQRWELILGNSSKKLEPLSKRLKSIDLFISDSSHYYDNEMMEFTKAWKFLKKAGILGIDDMLSANALKDFSKKVKRRIVTFQGPTYTMGFVKK